MEIKRIRKPFLTLIISFFLLNFFTAILLNNSYVISKFKENYFLTVELKGNLSEDEINKIENNLLSQQEVRSVRYVPREEAFRKLQKDLKVDISRSDNLLPDSLLVTFNKVEDIEKIQNILDSEQQVKEIFIDSAFIEGTQVRIKAMNLLSLFVIGIDLCIAIMIFSIFRNGVITDYFRLTILNPGNQRNYKKAQNINLFPFTGASIIGTLLFGNGYVIFKKNLLEILPDIRIISYFQMFKILGGIIILYNIFIWFSPNFLGRKSEENA